MGLTREESRAEPRAGPTVEEPEMEDTQREGTATAQEMGENNPQLEATDVPVPEEQDSSD